MADGSRVTGKGLLYLDVSMASVRVVSGGGEGIGVGGVEGRTDDGAEGGGHGRWRMRFASGSCLVGWLF